MTVKKLLALTAAAAIPAAALSGIAAADTRRLLEKDAVPSAQSLYRQVVTLPQTAPEAQEPDPYTPSIRVLDQGQVQAMELETYVQGVVLAEMPASFCQEAMKAQAVAARTFALKTGESGKHQEADVCTDSACCQAWQDPEAADLTQEHREKLKKAADETKNQVLTYGGALIDATYFSCSGGWTESAIAVWGQDVPYLRSVESPGEEDAAVYEDQVTVDKGRFCAIISSAEPQVLFDVPEEEWFSDPVLTPGGGVETIAICGCPFTGPRLRSLFGLRSTAFTVEVTEESVVFHTRGYGHRVGMSQYGANARAAFGETYDQILSYYYGGTELKALPLT